MNDTGCDRDFFGEVVCGCLLLNPELHHEISKLASYDSVHEQAKLLNSQMTDLERFGVNDDSLNCFSVGIVLGDGRVYVSNFDGFMTKKSDGTLSTIGGDGRRKTDYEIVRYPGLPASLVDMKLLD